MQLYALLVKSGGGGGGGLMNLVYGSLFSSLMAFYVFLQWWVIIL